MPRSLGPQTPDAIEVQFSPSQVGAFNGVLLFNGRWADGVKVSHPIALHGKARRWTDVPVDREARVEPQIVPKSDSKQDAAARAVAAAAPVSVGTLANVTNANIAASALARYQEKGLDKVAKAEIGSYERAKPDAPWWSVLAEMAISMATAGIANSLGKVMESQLEARLVAIVADAEFRKTLVTGGTNFLKEGVKAAGKRAAALTSGGSKQSTNAKVAFFAQQEDALIALEVENARMIPDLLKRLAPYEIEHPGITDQSLSAVTLGFNALSSVASTTQVEATELQWVAGIARAKLPSEDLGEGNIVTVGRGPHWRDDGVIEIDVTTTIAHDNHSDIPADSAHPTGARINGISQSVADRLWGLSLAREKIPMIFHVSGPGYHMEVRRDEAGRIMPSLVSLGVMTTREPMSERSARAVVDAVLSKPLSAWNVPQIKTDDSVKG